MKIELKANTEYEFLSKYLDFYNLLVVEDQRLNPSEANLMVEFALLPDKFNYQRFGSLAKSKVIESAASKDWKLTKLNINNKLYALLDKGFLKRDIDKVIYLPKHFLVALSNFRKNKTYLITIEFNEEKEQSISDEGNNSDS